MSARAVAASRAHVFVSTVVKKSQPMLVSIQQQIRESLDPQRRLMRVMPRSHGPRPHRQQARLNPRLPNGHRLVRRKFPRQRRQRSKPRRTQVRLRQPRLICHSERSEEPAFCGQSAGAEPSSRPHSTSRMPYKFSALHDSSSLLIRPEPLPTLDAPSPWRLSPVYHTPAAIAAQNASYGTAPSLPTHATHETL